MTIWLTAVIIVRVNDSCGSDELLLNARRTQTLAIDYQAPHVVLNGVRCTPKDMAATLAHREHRCEPEHTGLVNPILQQRCTIRDLRRTKNAAVAVRGG